MNKPAHTNFNMIMSELRSKTSLDAQEYKDFFVSIFFVFFISSHKTIFNKIFEITEIKKPSLLHDRLFFDELLLAANQIDIIFKNELDLCEAINHFLVRAGKINATAFKIACTRLYEIISTDEFPAIAGVFFENIIQNFSETEGKRAGEAYTPRELVEMMVEIVEPQGGESVYDPACGSGGFLISANTKALNHKNHAPLQIYGRDINSSAARIAKINCIAHGIIDSNIRTSDSLQEFETSAYDIVLANPPFSLSTSNYERSAISSYHDFGTPPTNNADFAFLQMIIKSLKPNGRAAVLISMGVLFRGGAEGAIRKNIIKAGVIESVICLPGGLLKSTGIPTAILVLKKPGTFNQSILLIDATEAGKYTSTNLSSSLEQLLSSALEKYKNLKEVEGSSKLVTSDELEKNDYNLNPARYISPQQAEEKSLTDLAKKQKKLENHLMELQKEFSELLKDHDINTH